MASLQIDLPAYQAALSELAFGKTLPTAIYIFWNPEFPIPFLLTKLVEELKTDYDPDDQVNVIKFHTRELKISLLSYPDFSNNPHPTLAESLSINLVTGKTRKTNYFGHANPPILHRKETFIPDSHKDFPKYVALTKSEEAAGLFENKATIGFQENWNQLLQEKGVAFRGHRLVKDESDQETREITLAPQGRRIDRHKTALSRSEFSKPVKTLLDFGQIKTQGRSPGLSSGRRIPKEKNSVCSLIEKAQDGPEMFLW